MGLQNLNPKRCKSGKSECQTLNDFQRSLGDISHLWHIIGIKPDQLIHLNKSGKDLNSPKELTAEAERELALVEDEVQIVHVDH
ncbi:hypothetical protein ACQP3L_32140, partial [Escherichia coli]